LGFTDKNFSVNELLERFPEVVKPKTIPEDLQSYIEYTDRSKQILREEREKTDVLNNVEKKNS